jgi:hypothetical protein
MPVQRCSGLPQRRTAVAYMVCHTAPPVCLGMLWGRDGALDGDCAAWSERLSPIEREVRAWVGWVEQLRGCR